MGKIRSKDIKLYEALGVEPDATQNEIKKAYYHLARETHPDKGGDKEKFQVIGHAYEILIDGDLRKKYDKTGKEGLKDAKLIYSKATLELNLFSDSRLFNLASQHTYKNEGKSLL